MSDFNIKLGLAKMLKGGVIMDVSTVEQALIAEKSGAVAVMALDRIPSQIRKAGGVARMASTSLIKDIKKAVTIPVMAKCRIGHFVEAQILEHIGVDFIDESEVLTPASQKHVNKNSFKIPFVCGARNLGEALRRINEGAAMIRTKGEAGTGDISQAVKHHSIIDSEIQNMCKTIKSTPLNTKNIIIESYAEKYDCSSEVILNCYKNKKLPVVNFAAGGIATPADAALMMQLGVDGVFVGSGIFEANNPKKMANAIVTATTHYKNPEKYSYNCDGAMKGIDASKLIERDKFEYR
tara:strand:- start:2809 stop:3690 length:882 start_codon:yes stop_codon:yes gene_type:complete